jgi:hypothetical protein
VSAKAKAATTTADKRVTRDDIESKLRELQGEVDSGVERVKVPTMAVVAGVVAVTIIGVYFLGRRRGRRRQLILEIKRI